MHHSTRRPFTLVCLAALLLALAFLAAPPAHAAATTYYVRYDATGANDGTNWIDAYTSLQTALTNAASGDQIWVAAGSYTPGSLRSDSFTLTSGVAVYGGFAGNETELSHRDWTANVTTLSGDHNGDDGASFANNEDNSYHVVTGASGATLDGFSITAGNANASGSYPNDRGGGIYNSSASPTLSNLIISGNTADYGGGMVNWNSNPTLTNVTISGNTASSRGGGIYNISSNPTLTNVTISGNTASDNGAAIYNFASSNPQIRNSIIWGNTAGGNASAIVNASGTATVSYSIVQGGYTGTGNHNLDPFFITAVPSAPSTGGDLRLQAGSPAFEAGNNDVSSPSLPSTDLAGNPRIVNGSVDMGAYERQTNLPPTLDQPSDLGILEDAGAQTVNLSRIGSGGGSQTLTINAVSSNPTLIPNPTVSYTSPGASASLSFTPAANANGTATITVTVQDSGGTDNGGVDTRTRSFTVTVSSVNDAPSFTLGPNQTVAASAGAQTVASWASGFSAGPADEASQTLLDYTIVSNTNSELFSVVAALDASGTLTYTPMPGASGTASIGVVVRDSGGTANGGVDTSAIHTFTITVGGSYQIFLPLVLDT